MCGKPTRGWPSPVERVGIPGRRLSSCFFSVKRGMLKTDDSGLQPTNLDDEARCYHSMYTCRCKASGIFIAKSFWRHQFDPFLAGLDRCLFEHLFRHLYERSVGDAHQTLLVKIEKRRAVRGLGGDRRRESPPRRTPARKHGQRARTEAGLLNFTPYLPAKAPGGFYQVKPPYRRRPA